MSTTDYMTVMSAFGEAMNRHDLDEIMALMTEDCVFNSSSGPDICGTHFEGQEDVRRMSARRRKGSRPITASSTRGRSPSAAGPARVIVDTR